MTRKTKGGAFDPASPPSGPTPTEAELNPAHARRFASYEALAKHLRAAQDQLDAAREARSPEKGILPSTYVIPAEWGPPTASWFSKSEVYKLEIECHRWDCPKTGAVLHEVRRLRLPVHGFDT